MARIESTISTEQVKFVHLIEEKKRLEDHLVAVNHAIDEIGSRVATERLKGCVVRFDYGNGVYDIVHIREVTGFSEKNPGIYEIAALGDVYCNTACSCYNLAEKCATAGGDEPIYLMIDQDFRFVTKAICTDLNAYEFENIVAREVI